MGLALTTNGRLAAVLRAVIAIIVTALAGAALVSLRVASGSGSDASLPKALIVPTVAHLEGAAGTLWRTDVELHNSSAAAMVVEIAFLERDRDNGSARTASFEVLPGACTRLVDVLASAFSTGGAGALRVTASREGLLVASRTYNASEAGTYGQFVPALSAEAAIGDGTEGRLIQLTEVAGGAGFRTNLGLVNVTAAPTEARVELFEASGAPLGTIPVSLEPFGVRQLDHAFRTVTGRDIADGYAVVATETAGALVLAWASVIDNATGDPYFVPAERVPAPTPPPTPTPTPSPTPTPPTPTPTPRPLVNLAFYTPSDWANCVICNWRWLTPPVYEFLSILHSTHVVWTVGNNGTSSVFGPIDFALLLDGQELLVVRYDNRSGLLPGTVLGLHFETRVGTMGRHTLTVVADPDSRIAEINEADNSCSFTGYWTDLPLGAAELGLQPPTTAHRPPVEVVTVGPGAVVRRPGSLRDRE